jgi:UPF0716 protein FxsA
LRREGRRTWRAFQEALAAGRVPTREVADGALVILGAALMIAPGFLTDIVGLLCLVPPTRSMLRRLLGTASARRLLTARARGRRMRSRPGSGPEIIEGEIEHP